MKKLFLFDCDETLWTSPNKDYVSSHNSPFLLHNTDTIIRSGDGLKFTLRPGVRQAFELINSKEDLIGVVSDNLPDPVESALKLLNLRHTVLSEASLVSLWEGYCPKDQMVLEILGNIAAYGISNEATYWFDDKDYTQQAASIGVNFKLITDQSNILALVSNIIS